jgi:hypothetical protein
VSTTWQPGFRHIRSAQQVRLSLSQRERIKVRDCFRHVSRARSRSPLGRCRVPCELGDSRTGEPEFAGEQEILRVQDRVFGQFDSYVRRRRAQSPALFPGSRNRGHKDQLGAAAGICNPRNCGFAAGATEDVPTWSDACGDTERGSRRYLSNRQFFQEVELTPHLNPLPLSKGRGGESLREGQGRGEFASRNPAIRKVPLGS